MLHIRDLRADEVARLQDFAPPEWKVDLSGIFGLHFGQPYFDAIAAELDGEVVGCASDLVQGNAGWLGNIIVLPQQRGRGIGGRLTQALIERLKARRVQFQILIATSLGEPVYRKLGFETVSEYVFFEREGAPRLAADVPGIRALTPVDEEAIFELDASVTGEMRRPFLGRFMDDAWVHVDPADSVDGYYLPSLGNGLVIAANDTAGLALMQHKLNQGASSSVLPERNAIAADFLRSNGFAEVGRAPRMTLGPDVDWQPEHVYCRGSGYCG